ncbi:MAG: hypothetical protein A3G92_03145 [Deltaproteobacteria bacterium RIFCSPLOWO2_12_FULL_38_8]|nr:MAG: hypothetical protein A3G92_03145 [Deltaproteobacteria bacterium RIFCSPLOWO2_12_FULL_38_8]
MPLALLYMGCVMGSGGDTTTDYANLVLGQSNFITTGSNANSTASDSSLSNPKGIFFDGTKLYIADTSNNRVLIWNTNPTSNKQSADVVVGQANKTSNSPNQGSTASCATLSGPTSVHVNGGRLFIADTGNHRILIYNTIPTSDGATANRVVGHADCTQTAANRLDGSTAGVRADTLSSPTDVFYNGSKMVIADSGNHRVLVYNSLPTNTSEDADVVVGQTDKEKASLNSPNANTLSSPSGVYANDDKLLIADTGNNRILIFNTIPTSDNTSANTVIGQTSMTTSGSGTSSSTLSGPTDIHADSESRLAIADKGNHRVLIYDTIPGSNGAAAHRVLGQADFTTAKANRDSDPAGNSLNGPSGVFSNSSIYWIADTFNNRSLRFSAD